MSEPLTRAEIVRKAARVRWSDPANRRAVRLDDLTREQRRLVLALVDAARSRPDEAKQAA